MASPLTVASVPSDQLATTLRKSGIHYHLGPFTVSLRTPIPSVVDLLYRMYGDYPLVTRDPIADFHIRLTPPPGPRRWIRPQVNFISDGENIFDPFPLDTAFPLLEWGLNWCIATQAHQYLMLHSAVVERQGHAVLFPAWPGSGKSTLCAALIHRGWRLLSDEFGLVRPSDIQMVPLPRCIPLKNESIEVIKDFAPAAKMGPTFTKTRKGDIAHLKPPADSIRRAHEPAVPRFIVFPNYTTEHRCQLTPLPKSRAFLKLAGNSFNYELLGAAGFRTVASIIRSSDCYILHFSDLDAAVATIDQLMFRNRSAHYAKNP
jgi:HprK-related kinase A